MGLRVAGGRSDQLPDAITRVRALGYRVGVVSNADGRVAALLDGLGLAQLVEFVIDMGADRLALPPHECVYLGDLYAVDVIGARAAGLVPLLLDPFDRFGDWEVERIATVRDLPGWLERRGSPAL